MMLLLIVEDNPSDTVLITRSIGDAFVSAHVDSLAEALQFFKSVIPDVVLLDLNLPDAVGFDALTILRGKYPDCPIVVWSGANHAAESAHLGADEFVLKSADNFAAIPTALIRAMSLHKFRSLDKRMETMQMLLSLTKEAANREVKEATSK